MKLAEAMVARNQTVLITSEDAQSHGGGNDLPGIATATVDPVRREAWRSLLENLPRDPPLAGVVHLTALDGRGASASTAEMAEDVTNADASALALLQGLADVGTTPRNGVWFLTRGAQLLQREPGDGIAGATLWGFGKTAALELPHLQPRMIDLGPDMDVRTPRLVDELLHPDPETHVALRGGGRYAMRVVRGGAAEPRIRLPDGSGWRLARDPNGALDRLRAEEAKLPLPGPGEIRVAVTATGVSFHDVLVAMGILDVNRPLGGEACGTVVAIGPEVTDLAVGDRVAGFAPGTFASETVTRADLVAQAPEAIPAAELATVPSAFVTAALAFEMAGLKSGQRVLIHAAAGGVGQAAIQLAQAAGAVVIATASTPKQSYLRSLGVKHVFDSRNTAFEQQVLEVTEGAGVEVVLNSLTGPGFIEASLSCLQRSGQFVEIGKRDIWSAEEVAASRPDVGYTGPRAGSSDGGRPPAGRCGPSGVMARVGEGELKPLAFSTWGLAEAGSAMEFMRTGRHLGKVVLTVPPLAAGRLRENGTYLVTGALGGIGREIAAWLAARGAGSIVMNGRREPDAASKAAIEALHSRGVRVHFELADVTDTGAVERMLDRISSTLPPLAGVVHCVGTLSDASLSNQSWKRFERVVWPKVLGAWNLHRATARLDLDLFVLCSSIAGVLGSAGQSNHAAANAFLDQLARHRRALGLAGTSVAWGAWSGLGEAEDQRSRIADQMEAAGVAWITPRQGLRVLDRLVRQDVTTSLAVPVDWTAFSSHFGSELSILEDLLEGTARRGTDASESTLDLAARLLQKPEAEREQLLVSFLQAELQAVLRLPSPPDPSAGFFDLGMDSLMAVELRNRINRAFSGSLAVSNTAVFDYPDTTSLAGHLAREVRALGGQPQEPARRAPISPGDDRVAIVGMACRFPGGPDLEAFWRQLEAGGNSVTQGRPDSGDELEGGFLPRGPVGDPACRWGSFVEGIDRFDAGFSGSRRLRRA